MKLRLIAHPFSITLLGAILVTARLEAMEVNIDFEDGSSHAGKPIGAFYATYGVTFSNAVWLTEAMIKMGYPWLGGHLTTINDEAEQNWIYDTFASFGGVPRYLWIGLSDEQVEGTFVWADGDSSTYRHWLKGAPDNYADDTGDQDYVRIYPPNVANPGLWNDVSGLAAHNASGVVEVVPGPAAQLAIARAVEIKWATQTTHRYQVQWASQLNPNAWYNLGEPIQGTVGEQRMFDSASDGMERFYRVITLPQ
jgi:hypothetical protein